MLNPDGRIKQLERRIEALAVLCDLDLDELDRRWPEVYRERRERQTRERDG